MFNKEDPNKKAMKKQQLIINQLLKKPENKFCADCKKKPPTWASMNLGVLVCIDCSGCHRQLGTHISKIKSVNLDSWPLDALENFQKINNKIANEYWEYNLHNFDFDSIKNNRDKIMEFIRNKYENKKWINQNEINPMSKIILQSEVNKVIPNDKYKISNFQKINSPNQNVQNNQNDSINNINRNTNNMNFNNQSNQNENNFYFNNESNQDTNFFRFNSEDINKFEFNNESNQDINNFEFNNESNQNTNNFEFNEQSNNNKNNFNFNEQSNQNKNNFNSSGQLAQNKNNFNFNGQSEQYRNNFIFNSQAAQNTSNFTFNGQNIDDINFFNNSIRKFSSKDDNKNNNDIFSFYNPNYN